MAYLRLNFNIFKSKLWESSITYELVSVLLTVNVEDIKSIIKEQKEVSEDLVNEFYVEMFLGMSF